MTTSNPMQHKIVTQDDWLRARRGAVLRNQSSVLCAALFLLSSIVPGHAQALNSKANPEPTTATIQPFKVHVPDRVLIDLRHRLAETKWPDQLPGTTWEYGSDIKKVRELADYWENSYDWRAQEAKINRFDQFTTEIDGQQIYFIHQRSPRSDAIPLLLIHGWPGSIVEFLALIEPLTLPKDSHSPAFHVIIPSLPGFGFSGPTTTRGWGPQRMAKALVVLMDRLGYSKYGIQGGDWGSLIARDMAYQAPAHVIGLHLNLITADPPNPEAVAQMSDAERKRYAYFDREESSFFSLQAAEPQTLAYALTDSPVGWLAWMIGKFQLLTDNNGDFLTAVDRDTFLTDVTLYWVTDTVGSAMRIYREHRLTREDAAPSPRLETPVAYADFPREVAVPPFRWITQTYNVVQKTEMPKGGHFAALEQPDLLVQDIRAFFAKLIGQTAATRRSSCVRAALPELGIGYHGSPIVEGDGKRYFDDSLRGGNGIRGASSSWCITMRTSSTKRVVEQLAGSFPEIVELRLQARRGQICPSLRSS